MLNRETFLEAISRSEILKTYQLLSYQESSQASSLYLNLSGKGGLHEFYIWKNAVAYYCGINNREFMVAGNWDMKEILKVLEMCVG